MNAVGRRWWLPPLLIVLLGVALVVAALLSGGLQDTILIVNYTKPTASGVEVRVDYRVQYAVSLSPKDSTLVLDISSNCSEAGREVQLGSQETGYVDLEPGEAVCRVYASNDRLGLSYLPPSSLDPVSPGVLDVYFSYPPGGSPLLSGFARLEFQVEEATISITNKTLLGIVKVEWLSRTGSQYEEHQCSPPCMFSVEPLSYSTSFNVYLVKPGFVEAMYILAFTVAVSLGLAYVLRGKKIRKL